MGYASPLEGAECPECGAMPDYWTKFEPTIIKVHAGCEACGWEPPSRVLKKDSDDTSEDAVEDVARDAVDAEHGTIF